MTQSLPKDAGCCGYGGTGVDVGVFVGVTVNASVVDVSEGCGLLEGNKEGVAVKGAAACADRRTRAIIIGHAIKATTRMSRESRIEIPPRVRRVLKPPKCCRGFFSFRVGSDSREGSGNSNILSHCSIGHLSSPYQKCEYRNFTAPRSFRNFKFRRRAKLKGIPFI